ncbi:MAG: hypothetical protein QM817_31895 [Archangium sp.]
MRALFLGLLMVWSSGCVPVLAFALAPAGEAQRRREWRAREAAYRAQLTIDAAAARKHYNETVRDAPEVALATPAPAESLSPPPLPVQDPPRKPLAPLPCATR